MPAAPTGHPVCVRTDDETRPAVHPLRGYDPRGQVNLAGYAGSLAAYAGAVGAVLAAGRSRGDRLPAAWSVQDLVLGGVAVHKFSRVLATSSVASPVRAPFTRFEEPTGSSEHHERPRGTHGLRHTVGELLTCPFCLGVWASTAYVVSLGARPQPTRAWAAVFTVSAISDSLQHVYARLRGD